MSSLSIDEIKAALTTVDLADITAQLHGIINEGIASLAGVATDELNVYGVDISEALLKAIENGDTDSRNELLHQIKALAELGRLSVTNNEREIFDRATKEIVTVATKVANALLQLGINAAKGALT
jgi:UDP-N-acetyl-D-mannosaminuronate dehydrogenase